MSNRLGVAVLMYIQYTERGHFLRSSSLWQLRLGVFPFLWNHGGSMLKYDMTTESLGSSPASTVGCINFNFFGNIKNRQPAYASLGSLEDHKIFFFFFDPKTKASWPPKVWYFWKFPQSLLVIF